MIKHLMCLACVAGVSLTSLASIDEEKPDIRSNPANLKEYYPEHPEVFPRVVRFPGVLVRDYPGMSGAIVGWLEEGSVVEVEESEGCWLRVGWQQYISCHYASVPNDELDSRLAH